MKNIWCVGSLGIDIIIGPLADLLHIGELVIAPNISEDTGGCAGNVARTIAKIGGNAKLIARVGNDNYGEFARTILNNDGVDIRYINQDINAKTGVSIVIVSDKGERTFIYAPGANYKLEPDDITRILGNILPGDIIHFSDTFLLPLLDGIPIRDILLETKKLGIITSLDTSWDAKGRWINLIESYFPHLDYFFTNISEAKQLFPGMSLEKIIEEIAQLGANNVVVKMGENGVLVKEETKKTYKLIPNRKLKPIDTTGAGDSFVGAFLTGIQGGLTIKDSTRFSMRVAEKNIMKIGATAGVPEFNSFKDAEKQLLFS